MDPSTDVVLQGVDAKALGDPAWRPTPEQGAAAASVQTDLFERASKMPECDFGLELREDGPFAVIPHLGSFRTSVKAMMVSARAELDEGRIDQAVGRIAACLRASTQVGHDDIIIQALTRRAMYLLVAPVLAVASPRLSAAHKATLHEALVAFTDDDPFRIASAMKSERNQLVPWIEKVVQNGPGPKLDAVLSALSLGPEDQKRARELAADPARAAQELQKLAAFYDEGIRVMTEATPAVRATELDKRVQQGEFGVMASFFFADFGGLGERITESRHTLADAKALVAKTNR